MHLVKNKYYHFYNRSNNKEVVFKENRNYLYFLIKYRKYLSNFVNTICYCLMPDHFHFLIKIVSEETDQIKTNIGILLSSYTKAINKSFNWTGSLFQEHTKAKLVEDEEYMWKLINYIHQNPLRKGLVDKINEWEFSSYKDLAGLRNGSLVDRSLYKTKFNSENEFRFFSSSKIEKFDYMFGD